MYFPHRLVALAVACVLPCSAVVAELEGEPFAVPFAWRQKAEADRHTSLLATFDEKDGLRADHAWGDATGVLYRAETGAEGKWGKALALVQSASIAHFRAGPSLNSAHGTIDFWVRSAPGADLWGDGKEHWLFAAEGRTRTERPVLALFKRAKDNALVLYQAPRRRFEAARALVHRPGKLDPAAWHHVLASWDRAEGRLWLAVDGKGVTGSVGKPFSRVPFFVLWLGSSGSDRHSFAPLGGFVDQLRCSDITVAKRGTPPKRTHPAVDLGLLAKAELALRRWFGFMARVQAGGGWANCYTWPTLLPSPTGSRDFIWPRGFVSNDKGHVGPAGCWLVQGSEVLRDPWHLHLGERMADAYAAAQMPQGCWYFSYLARPEGLVPISPKVTKVKLQDQNQVHPMYMLLYVHRLTGKEEYRKAAMRAGEFLLRAQNPNGSWSHSFDLARGIGLTARGQPQGGEINDLACNDGMDAMVLMYHFTKERKYLDAFVRCAQWFLAAQLGPPTFGWAQQYDAKNQPVWARAHEPPATSMSASHLAYAALRQAWWITGERRYLEAPRKFFEWMAGASRDGGYCEYYDPGTGRPIVADGRRVYALDDPGQVAAFRKISVKISYAAMRRRSPRAYLERIDGYLEGGPPPVGAPADLEAVAAGLPARADAVRAFVAQQNEAGAWVRRGQGELRASGPVVWIRQTGVRRLLAYVEDCRVLLGELPNTFRGRGGLLRCAYPNRDWYDTPLRKPRR